MKHYALTDQKEFFAEMAEAYFGMNDFFPFNRAELKTAEPEIYALLERIWGPPFKGRGAADAVVSTQFAARRRLALAAANRAAYRAELHHRPHVEQIRVAAGVYPR